MAWRKTLAVLTLIAILLGLASPALARNYGDFSPTDATYQADWRPFNDGRFAEVTNFSCVMSDGKYLGTGRQKVLGDILEIGGKIYGGKLEKGDFRGGEIDFSPITNGDSREEDPYGSNLAEDGAGGVLDTVAPGPISDGLQSAAGYFGIGNGTISAAQEEFLKDFEEQEKYKNLGYETGKEGLQDYLSDIKSALSKGTWSTSKDTAVRGPGFLGAEEWTPDSRVLLFDAGPDSAEDRDLPRKDQRVMARIINSSAYAPIDSFKLGGRDGLPPGCPIEPFDPGDNIGLDDIVSDFDGSFTALLFTPINKLVQGAYSWVSPLAMKYSFWTAHTERGDIIWSVPDSCDPDSKGNPGVVRSSAQDGCKGGQELGYSEKNLDVDNQGEGAGIFIKLAEFIKWLLSGTYMLIIFAAAALFIVRGSTNNNFNLLKLLPRLLLSMVLTLLIPYLMGMTITFSNSLVQTFFGSGDGELIAQINLILSQSGVVIGGGEFFQRLVNTIVGGFSTWYMLLLFIIALARQIALIVLVVIAPIAAFSLISESWRPFFTKWLKAFLAVAFIPVLLALILKLGVMINPLYGDSAADAYGTMAGTLGVILMVVILFAMTKVARAAKDFAIGQSSMATGAMSGVGSGLAAAGAMTGNQRLAGLGNRMGQRVQDSASRASSQAASGSLIPQGRGTAAGAAGASAGVTGALGWAERRKAKALAKGGVNEIDEGTYYQQLAEQTATGESAFFNQYGYTVEKKGGSYFKNFSAPGGASESSGPSSPKDNRAKRVRKAKGSFDATSVRHASKSGATPRAGASSSFSRHSTGGAGFSASSQSGSAPSPAQPISEQPASKSKPESKPTAKPKATTGNDEDSKAAAAFNRSRQQIIDRERRSERRE
jgi:hypothetical protein